MDMNESAQALLEVRDQAQAAERKRALLWAADQCVANKRGHYELGEFLRRAAKDGGK